jgi:hypothetical protein
VPFSEAFEQKKGLGQPYRFVTADGKLYSQHDDLINEREPITVIYPLDTSAQQQLVKDKKGRVFFQDVKDVAFQEVGEQRKPNLSLAQRALSLYAGRGHGDIYF